MRVVLETPAGVRDVELRARGTDVTVGELLAAAGAPSRLGARLDGRVRPSDLMLDEIGLYEGAVLGIDGVSTTPPASAPLELRVIAGFDAGRRLPLSAGTHVIGRDLACDLVLKGRRVSRRHCQLDVHDGSRRLILTDLGSGNGTWLEGHRLEQPAELVPGAVFDVGDTAFTVARVDDRRDRLTLDPLREVGPGGTMPFNRPPRALESRDEDVLKTPSAPVSAPKARFSVVSALGPLVLGVVMVIALGNPLYALFTLLSPVMVVGNWYENRRRTLRDSRGQTREHSQALARFDEQLDTRQHRVRMRLRGSLPDLAELLYRATAPSARLWERRSADDDFLILAAGLADMHSRPDLADRQAPDEHVEGLLASREVLPSVPVAVELAQGGVVGIVGPRRSALAAARALVCQAAVLHGPADVSVAVLTESDRVADWEWTKWLPHVRDVRRGEAARLLAGSDPEWQALAARLAEEDVSGESLLVVLDGDGLITGRSAVGRQLLRAESRPSGIVIASAADRLPAACSHVLVAGEEASDSQLQRPRQGSVVDRLVVAGMSASTARSCALAIARFEDPELHVPGAGLPAQVPLVPLLGLPAVDPAAVAAQWRRNRQLPSLAAPIGVGEDGPFVVDLVRDGPHGLVAGTTGAGKSELLRTLISSLASAHGPDELNFVLVDYKGGAAFGECARLPHTVGMVTDLDEELGERALRSLEAELRYRERMLREQQAADLGRYQEIVRAGKAAPLPRLLVIIDEFATLAEDLPEFVNSLVGIAQRGRSLGVHLVLATQRPAGVVNQNIRANTNLRVCLRVQSPQDSLDVIESPLAGGIGRDQPGRAYLRLGPSELIAIQAALVTSAHVAQSATGVTIAPFAFGQPPPQQRADGEDRPARSDLSRLTQVCREASDLARVPPPRPPWLSPLPGSVDLERLLRAGQPRSLLGDGAALAPLGVADDPDAQSQYLVGWDLQAGNLLLFGITGSGTTTALASTAVGLAQRLSPAQLHLYALDFGAGALAPLASLPHVGAVIGGSDHERQRRLLARLRATIEHRRHLDAVQRASSPLIVLLLDGYAGFVAEHSDAAGDATRDLLARVWADGPELGVCVALSAERVAAVPNALAALATQRLAFRLADPADYSQFGVRRRTLPHFVPGRAIVAGTGQVLQVAHTPDGLEAAVRRTAAAHPEVTATARPEPVRALPSSVSVETIASAARLDGDSWCLPVGIGERTLAPAGLELHEGEHALISGAARSGKSTLLCLLASLLAGLEPEALIFGLAPRRSPLRECSALTRLLADASELSAVAQEASSRPTLLLVDDAENVDDQGRTLNGLLSAANASVHVIAAGRAESLRQAIGHWTAVVRRSRTGVLLAPDLYSDGQLLGAVLPRRHSVPPRPGLGYLVQGGEIELVQVALPAALEQRVG